MSALDLLDPLSGEPLAPDTPHSLSDGESRWPVVAGIPYLRLNRDGLRAEALDRLDDGEERGALVALLRDQDDYAPDPPPDEAAIGAALDEVERGLSLRGAMQALGFGPVSTYFAHRWSAPTFLSGLALLQRYWTPERPLVEVACGIGQILREAERRGGRVVGVDVVFAKLWLARRFVLSGNAELVCADAERGLPLPPLLGSATLCHDAFYFLRRKPEVLAEMRRIAGPEGAVLIGHAHNSRHDHGRVSGEPWTPEAYADLAPWSGMHDDAELAASLLPGGRDAPARSPDELHGVEALAMALGEQLERPAMNFALPIEGAKLRLNPLLRPGDDGRLAPAWPSEAFAKEYRAATYLTGEPVPSDDLLARAAEGITNEPETARLYAKRVLLDLPGGW